MGIRRVLRMVAELACQAYAYIYQIESKICNGSGNQCSGMMGQPSALRSRLLLPFFIVLTTDPCALESTEGCASVSTFP